MFAKKSTISQHNLVAVVDNCQKTGQQDSFVKRIRRQGWGRVRVLADSQRQRLKAMRLGFINGIQKL